MTNPSTDAAANDAVNHPAHYTQHKSGIECIQITEHMGFNLGNAYKYLTRCELKQNVVEDLRKALWYVEREMGRLSTGQPVRSERPRPGTGLPDPSDPQTGTDKEWLFDYYVFFAKEIALSPSLSAGNIHWPVPFWNGSVTSERNPHRLPTVQLDLGVSENQPSPEVGSRDFVPRGAESWIKTDAAASGRDTGEAIKRCLTARTPEELRRVAHDDLPYRQRRIVVLSKHLWATTSDDKTRASFYVAVADLKNDAIEDLRKAQWYIDRELAKRQNEQVACRVETSRTHGPYPRSWNIPRQ